MVVASRIAYVEGQLRPGARCLVDPPVDTGDAACLHTRLIEYQSAVAKVFQHIGGGCADGKTVSGAIYQVYFAGYVEGRPTAAGGQLESLQENQNLKVILRTGCRGSVGFDWTRVGQGIRVGVRLVCSLGGPGDLDSSAPDTTAQSHIVIYY